MASSFAYHDIGRRIRELRGTARQKDWATRIGCDQGYISQVENGVTKPSLSFLKEVGAMTNASIDWILTGRGERAMGDRFHSFYSPEETVSDVADEEVLQQLKESPRLVLALSRLLSMDERGKVMIEALSEMDSNRIEGLALLMGLIK